jgi:hypothetical protein
VIEGLKDSRASGVPPNEAGRFISPDPKGHAVSLDLYSYANGDPANLLDPDGRFGRNLLDTGAEVGTALFRPFQNIFQTLNGENPFNLLNPLSRQFLGYELVRGPLTAGRLAEGLPFSILSGDIFYHQDINPASRSAYINGVFTSRDDRILTVQAIEDHTGWSGTVGIRNSTLFYIGDIIQILGEELGGITTSSIFAAEQIRAAGGGDVIAHSQGTSVFRGTVALLNNDTRAAIDYQGLGAESYNNGSLYGLGNARTVYNPGDPVPYMSPFDYVRTFMARTIIPFDAPEILPAHNDGHVNFGYHLILPNYVTPIHP